MASEVKTISIIGSGNVAHHLGKAFANHITIVSVHSRNIETGSELAEELDAYFAEEIDSLLPADLFLVCVSDDEVNTVISQLPEDAEVAYTSGSVSLKDIDKKENLGVIYPLQTFSKEREIDLFEVPFFIEATSEVFGQKLFDLSWLLSRKVVFANSEERRNLHLVAVMVNNFVNHIDFLAEKFLKSKSLEMDFIKPLIKETALKLQSLSPQAAQTGPAIRHDSKTIASHIDMLDGDTKEIYKLLTESIQKHHQK